MWSEGVRYEKEKKESEWQQANSSRAVQLAWQAKHSTRKKEQ